MAKEVKRDAKGFRKFGMRDSLAYAAGDFGCNMSFALKGTMMIFWTQFMGLEHWYSLLLIVVQVWDAINDPVIGSLIDADKRKYKRNKFLQYISFGSIGLIVAGALCFLPFPQAPIGAQIIIFVCGYVIWDAFYTVANVPYGSLLSLISSKPADRASLSAWRSIGSMVGNMVPMAILPMIIYDANDNLIGERVFLAALIMGALGFITFQLMIHNTEIREETEVRLNDDQPRFNVLAAMKNFVKNRPAVGATLAAVGMFIGMQGGAAAVTVLFQSYFKNVQISGIINLFAMIPIVLFTPLARKMVTRYGKKELATIGAIVQIIACGLMFVAAVTGLMSPDVKGIAIYVVCQLLNSLGMGIYSTVSWAMMGDAIDYNEWKTGSREEGTVYALHSFFRKLAQGIGPAVALQILLAIGYVGANEGNQVWEVAEKMPMMVAALYLLSAVAGFIGLGLIYNLDKKSLEKMNAELEERRGTASQAE